MRITVEQQLPADLGTLRKFLDAATRLVDADMTALVTIRSDANSTRFLSVCSARELKESSPSTAWGDRVKGL